VEGIVKKDPEVVFHTGDLVNDGMVADQWETFNNIVAEIVEIADFYPALGNHEKNADYYFNNFTLPGNERWYSVDVGGATFIILDSNTELNKNSEQYNWFEAELMKRKASDIIAVIFHHPPYSTGGYEEDEKGVRDTIVPLFEQYGVDIVFSGHDHTYERLIVNGVYYIVTGGAGAPLYDQTRESPYSVIFQKEYHFCVLEITNESLLVTVYTAELDVIDDFVVIESVIN
jgi:3',5'-cyclic AMP phosphodiesterase CpdA